MPDVPLRRKAKVRQKQAGNFIFAFADSVYFWNLFCDIGFLLCFNKKVDLS
jgi:hypothetical protein